MKALYKKSIFTLFIVLAFCIMVKAQSASVDFDLNACDATLTGSHMDYSEFTGNADNSSCASLTVQGGYLYRNNPTVNTHSCTPGLNGSEAMCIGSNPSCTFTSDVEQALRADILVTPGSIGNATLSEISFYEKGPAQYVWINGASGPNNYPTLFGIRILKNGTEIFLSTDIPTELNWNLNTFSFSGPEFTVSEPTLFNIEILPYCPIGNGEPVSAWDIEDLRIIANCCEAPNGGTLTGGPFEFCVGDDIPDNATGILLSGQTGDNTQWVITDNDNNIVNLPVAPELFDFDDLGAGTSLIYSVSFEDGLAGLEVGNNLLNDLVGCFGLSNSITVLRNQPQGGTLTGGPFEFCAGDSTDVTSIVLTGNVGPNSQFLVINTSNTILSLPGSLDEIDLNGSSAGVFFIQSITFYDTLTGLAIGNNLGDVTGCLALSNTVTVTINESDGGTLTGGPFEFCVGDSIPDYISGVVLTGNVGDISQWVVTNDANMILSLPADIDSVNFDGGGPGVCLIWNITYFNSLTGLVPGNNLLTDVIGCFDLSNSITVTRNQPNGGVLEGGPFEFCVGDGVPDHISGLQLFQNVGNSQWVVTNGDNIILGLPTTPEEFNFEEGTPGDYFIRHVSYYDPILGLIVGNNLVNDVTGCISLSSPITITRNQPDGGTLTGGPFNFCVGDSIPDYVSGVVLTGNVGETSQWVITNDSNMILSLPANIDSVNFDGGGPGICLIWNISYFDPLSGLTPGNNLLTDVEGCSDLSNSITVNRNQPEGGNLIGGPFEFCAGDSSADVTSIILTGNVGANSQWVVTNDVNTIMSIAGSLDEIQFVGNDPGVFLIWNISYFDTLSGLIVGNNLFEEVTGCSGISDSVIVILTQPDGGTLTGGPFEFCVGDGVPDYVSGIVLNGDTGNNSQWVITDAENNILFLPGTPDTVNFDMGLSGPFFIWHVSYDNAITGLEIGNNLLTDVNGCFGLSNPLTVVRNEPAGGELIGGPFSFCVGDSITDVTEIILSGNVGDNSQWVVIDELNTIIILPDSLGEISFGGNGPGTFLIVNLSSFGTVTGLDVGNNLLEDVSGCLAISDSIVVTLSQPLGGELTGGPFEFCIGDSIADYASGIVLTGEIGENLQWVITDNQNNILSLPFSPDSVNFDLGTPGTCLIWNVSYNDGISGLEVGNNLFTDVTGCYAVSNPIMVIRNQPDGGALSGGPFELCIGDSTINVTEIVLTGNVGDSSQWVLVNDSSIILNLPDSLQQINFGGTDPGTYFIVNISYFDTLTGLIVGNHLIDDVSGCLAISDSITVTINQPSGGELIGGPFEFCVGDTIPDHVSGIDLIGNIGAQSQYVVTDSAYNILSLPLTPEEFDFNEGPPGNYLIVHVSYYGLLIGLEIGNSLLTDLEGCFSLSNALTVVRVDCEGFQGDPIFELKLSPNPVREIMTVKMNYKGNDIPVVQIYDVSGRLCFKERSQPDGEMTIDMSHFYQGCYIVRVVTPEGSKTESIIVIK